ncbi:MAG: metallophosphoesterase family protein [Planctomycetota bacterium]
MLIGVAADAHDHVAMVRRAVERFNAFGCDAVVFAGDFVSPIVLPAWRGLNCRMVACFGDNEGNEAGIVGGMRILGTVGRPPFGHRFDDGSRLLLAHAADDLVGGADGNHDWSVVSHTHRPKIGVDAAGRPVVNPGELCGWVSGVATVATFETATGEATLHELGRVDRGR